MNSVQLDSRTRPEFFDETIRLAKIYCPQWNLPDEWPSGGVSPQPSADAIAADPGLALFRIFSCLAGYLADIENALPVHWQLAFYRFLNANIRTALPAFAPLQFSLSAGQPPVMVPAGTAVLDVATQSVRFATYDDLNVVPASLSAALCVSPALDLYADGVAAWQRGDYVSAFFGASDDHRPRNRHPLGHWLLIGDSVLIAYDPAVTKVELTLTGSHLFPCYFEQWCDGTLTEVHHHHPKASDDGRSFSVIFEKPFSQAEKAVSVAQLNAELVAKAGYGAADLEIESDAGALEPSYWRVVRPAAHVRFPSDADVLPKLREILCTVSAAGALPQQAAANNSLLDLTKGAYPFGKNPAVEDAFYVRSDKAFAYGGGEIHLRFVFSGLANDADARVDWQFWNDADRAWVSMGEANGSGPYRLKDGTENLTKSGEVSFTCPTMGRQTIAGTSGYWIRAVLKAFDGANGFDFQPLAPAIDEIPSEILPDSYKSPVVAYIVKSTKATFLSRYQSNTARKGPFVESLKIDYTVTARPKWLWRHNAFQLENMSSLKDRPYPYLPLPNTPNLLYLGLRRNDATLRWAGEEITLYFHIHNEAAESGPALSWEWLDSETKQWRPLDVMDRSAGLGRSATVRFIVPDTMQEAICFSQRACWLRVAGAVAPPVLMKGIYLNTTGAKNVTTYTEVIIGSSNGLPNQTFSLPFAGVHEVQQGEALSARNVGAQPDIELVVEEPVALDGTLSPELATQPETEKFAWTLVDSFVDQDASARVYAIEPRSGTVVFGDGVRGRIPPLGTHNIIVESYCTTAGKSGNVAANALGIFGAGIPGIAKVSNPVAARGGVDGESLSDLVQDAPERVRANDRVVTLEDVKALAEQASSRVAQAVAIEHLETDKAAPWRHVALFVLAQSDEARALTAPAVLDEVLAYVQQRSPIPLQSRITVSSARFKTIDVAAVLKTAEPRDSWPALRQTIDGTLTAFLHPVNGGPPGGSHWIFGKPVLRADVFACLLGTPGVNAVDRLALCGGDYDVILRRCEVPCAGAIQIAVEAY
ncbi:baseplate J/gp47 family protein [Trinickia dinghuensis]|nr:baseplate J/gp47 family protein [Trinickia dinghuensis]